jgi:hypothetical protein
MMCVSMSDPGMLVLPTHRLFRGLPPMTSDKLMTRLGDFFRTETMNTPVEQSAEVWSLIEAGDEQHRLALFTAEDATWHVAELTTAGREKLALIASERTPQWRELGVSILHRLIMDTLLDAANLPAPKYVHSIDEVIDGLRRGDTSGRDATGQQGSGARFELAALVMPATLEHIRTLSAAGERMPPKSTYFYPKLLSGLVINPLE